MNDKKKVERLLEIVKVQDEYIALLHTDISEHTVFLYVHGIVTKPERVQKGEWLRSRIAELKRI